MSKVLGSKVVALAALGAWAGAIYEFRVQKHVFSFTRLAVEQIVDCVPARDAGEGALVLAQRCPAHSRAQRAVPARTLRR